MDSTFAPSPPGGVGSRFSCTTCPKLRKSAIPSSPIAASESTFLVRYVQREPEPVVMTPWPLRRRAAGKRHEYLRGPLTRSLARGRRRRPLHHEWGFQGDPRDVRVRAFVDHVLEVRQLFLFREVGGHITVDDDGQARRISEYKCVVESLGGGALQHLYLGPRRALRDDRVEPGNAPGLFRPETGLQPQSIVVDGEVQWRRIDTDAGVNVGKSKRAINRRFVVTNQRQGIVVICFAHRELIEVEVDARRSSDVHKIDRREASPRDERDDALEDGVATRLVGLRRAMQLRTNQCRFVVNDRQYLASGVLGGRKRTRLN